MGEALEIRPIPNPLINYFFLERNPLIISVSVLYYI